MKATLPILALVLGYSTQVSQAIECFATTTSAGTLSGGTSFGSRAFPQVADTFTVPDAPTTFKSCIKYQVFGGLVVTASDRVVYTTIVDGIDGQGTLNTCAELLNPDGSTTRTGQLYTSVRYRPASVWNVTCCETANCNDNLGMLFTTYLGASVPFSSSIMLMFSALLGFLLIFRLV